MRGRCGSTPALSSASHLKASKSFSGVRPFATSASFARQVAESDDEEAPEEDQSQVWTSNSRAMRIRMSMPLESKIWTEGHSMTGLDRQKKLRAFDCIDLAYWSYLLACPLASQRSPSPSFFCDASQGCLRKPWGVSLPSLNQDSIPYSFRLDRVLSVEDRPSISNQNQVLSFFLDGIC